MKTVKFFSVLLLSLSACTTIFKPTDDVSKCFDAKYIKTVMNKAAEWQIAHPKHSQKDWTNGAFYAGMFAAWETTKSDAIYNAMHAMAADSNKWRLARRWYHADDHVIAQTYIDLYRESAKKEPVMLQAITDTMRKFLIEPYPVRGIEIIKWWWCDALFMGPPTMVKLSMTTGDKSFMKYSDVCYHECYDLLYNKEEHLFARDLNYVIKGDSKDRFENNGKRIFWSRGNGWVLGGLVRILKELPADYPERPFYETVYKEMCAKIVDIQQADGLWRASLLDPEAYPGGEVSGSGFFCYSLAWGVNNGLLDAATYAPAAKKAWAGLNRCVAEDGRVGWVQPIGADPRKNFGADSWEVYGTGAFLLAGSEIIKMKK
ncbi:MAG: glycoside hydrolase family 88 protein [Tannerella sp.]|nr:glycoside hydrolase family 88 protein [Tannerella sp.]